MITIVDYEAGNITSVERALSFLDIPFRTTKKPEEVKNSDRIIFPGVGHAKSAMEFLNKSGLAQALREEFSRGNPFLGICLGSQIILESSEEGPSEVLGLAEGCVRFFPNLINQEAPSDSESRIQAHSAFNLANTKYKVPHMGWNTAIPSDNEIAKKIFSGVSPESQFYFVHSYVTEPQGQTKSLCETEYGIKFASGIQFKNLVSFQFHPEKSGEPGLRLLKNFSEWKV